MVQTFAAYIHSLPDPQEQTDILEGLPQVRREKIMNHKTVEGRKQSLGAGLLLKQVLEKYGISLDAVRTDNNGKPVVCCAGRYAEAENSADECAAVNGEGVRPDKCIEKLAQNLPQLCFNLSHSGDLVVCAVSEKEVGCDAEKIGPARMKVAKRFFSEEENQYLEMFEPGKEEEHKQEQTEPGKEEECKQEQTEPGKEEECKQEQTEPGKEEERKQERNESGEESTRDREFCRLWTIREAYIKMTGEGMRLDFRKFEVRPVQECLAGDEQQECPAAGKQPERTTENGGLECGAVGKRSEWKKNSLCIFREGIREACRIQEYEIEDYCISVCARENEFAESINWVEL